jgi:hypothetical protein
VVCCVCLIEDSRFGNSHVNPFLRLSIADVSTHFLRRGTGDSISRCVSNSPDNFSVAELYAIIEMSDEPNFSVRLVGQACLSVLIHCGRRGCGDGQPLSLLVLHGWGCENEGSIRRASEGTGLDANLLRA